MKTKILSMIFGSVMLLCATGVQAQFVASNGLKFDSNNYVFANLATTGGSFSIINSQGFPLDSSGNLLIDCAANCTSGTGIATVATLPVGKPAGTTYVVTDGSTGTDCTGGGGANFVFCRYSGAVWGTFSGGTAAAGGGANTIQFNNATALGGVAQWTSNGTTTITGSATSILDLHAAGTGGLLMPGALSTGIVKVTTTTGAISILTAPAGTIVGTSDTQALTNKDLTGAGNTFPSLAGDVTGPIGTTVVAKINGNSVTSGAANNQALICTSANTCVWKTLPDCAGSSNALNFTQSTNVFSCLSITTLSNPMTTLGDVIYGGSAGAVTRLAGPTTPNGVPQSFTSNPSGGAAVAPAWTLPGIGGRAITGTTATDTILATDCNPKRVEYVGSVAVAVTLPTAATLAVPTCVFKLTNNLSTLNDVTVTPTTWTVNGGASVAIHQGQVATLYVDSNSATNWVADVEEEGLSAGSNITFTRSATGLSIASTGGGSLSGMTAGQVPIAATASTVTSSEVLAGAGAGITTGPTSSTTLDVTEFTGTGGQIADSGVAVANLTQTTATPAANQICVYGSTAKTCTPTTALPTAAEPAHTGDVTNSAGSLALSIAANAVTLAKMATQANATVLSNVSGGTAVPSANALPTTANALIKTSNANGALAASLTTDDGTTSTYTGTGGSKSPVFASTGSTAGFHDYAQGTTSAAVAPCNTATSICEQAPTAVTSYLVTKPGAAGTGVRIGVNASNVVTETFSNAFGAVSQTAKTAAVTTFTVCSANANTACGQVGQYRLTYNVWGSGTACSAVTAGSVVLNLTWTDENATAHTTINVPMWDQKTAAMTSGQVNFNTALGTEGGSGSMIISTNGTIIQAATTYTTCTTGTGTYNLRITTEQLQ